MTELTTVILEGGETVEAHPPETCAGEVCCIHNPTDHHMRKWKQHWRSDRGIMERICPHGVGHPDPDDLSIREGGDNRHGCDGCCKGASYPERQEPDEEEPEAPKVKTHAIITPWPLSQGLRVWCGYDAQDPAIRGHMVATTPEKVDCEQCKASMKRALKNLEEWIPGLEESS